MKGTFCSLSGKPSLFVLMDKLSLHQQDIMGGIMEELSGSRSDHPVDGFPSDGAHGSSDDPFRQSLQSALPLLPDPPQYFLIDNLYWFCAALWQKFSGVGVISKIIVIFVD